MDPAGAKAAEQELSALRERLPESRADDNLSRDPAGEGLRKIAFRVAIAGTFLAAATTFGVLMWCLMRDLDFRKDILETHAQVAVGFPVCTCNAFATVIVLQATSGPIEFKALGIEFKGAGGPLAFYILTFLVTVGAFHLLWHG